MFSDIRSRCRWNFDAWFALACVCAVGCFGYVMWLCWHLPHVSGTTKLGDLTISQISPFVWLAFVLYLLPGTRSK